MAITDAAGKITAEGVSILIARIAAAEGIPESVRGDIVGTLHVAKPLLIGLAKEVAIAAIKAVRDGREEEAAQLILATSKQERLLSALLDRAEGRTQRASIRSSTSRVYGLLMSALTMLATKVVVDLAMSALAEVGDGTA